MQECLQSLGELLKTISLIAVHEHQPVFKQNWTFEIDNSPPPPNLALNCLWVSVTFRGSLRGLRLAVIEDTYKNIFMCLRLRKQFPKRISKAVLSIIEPLEMMEFFQTHSRTLHVLMKVHSSNIALCPLPACLALLGSEGTSSGCKA